MSRGGARVQYNIEGDTPLGNFFEGEEGKFHPLPPKKYYPSYLRTKFIVHVLFEGILASWN